MRRMTTILAVVGALTLGLGACTSETPQSSQRQETERRQATYDDLVARQPAHSMEYSPTRDQINFWIDTWGTEEGKLSYVYLLASNGQMIGYYVFRGLPVSYCAALTPTYEHYGWSDSNTGVTGYPVPAPGVDGVYYSGGQCSAYYGQDASTGSYLEYTVGQGISALIYEQPLPRQDVEPLGFTEIGG